MRKQPWINTILAVTVLLAGGLLGFATSTSTSSVASAAVSADADPVAVAQAELPIWVGNIGSDYQAYGFESESELAEATVGTPYPVYALNPDALQAYQSGQSINALIGSQLQWDFPVLVHGKGRGVLTVAQLDGQLHVVQFGGLQLSQKIVRLQQRLSASQGAVKLITFFPSYSTFALVEKGGKESLIHLSSAVGLLPNLDSNNLTPYAPEVAVPQIKATYAEIKAHAHPPHK